MALPGWEPAARLPASDLPTLIRNQMQFAAFLGHCVPGVRCFDVDFAVRYAPKSNAASKNPRNSMQSAAVCIAVCIRPCPVLT
eukprot:3152280-Rhodomonas_salina.1